MIVGAALIEAPQWEAALPAPAFDVDPDEVARLYPHRYAGLSLARSRRTLAAGAAWRAAPWLAIGGAATLSDVAAAERRAIWAGAPARDAPGDPRGDLVLAVHGRDRVVPGASAGFLAAPSTAPVELAGSLEVTAGASLRGDASLSRTRDARFPEPRADAPTAALRAPSSLTARAGARYLGARLLVEVGAELTRAGRRAPAWSLSGLQVAGELGELAPVDGVAAAHAPQNRSAVRGAVDVAVVPGFLWARAGYAYATAAAAELDFHPTYAAPASHTAAFGVEASWERVGVSLGYARHFARAVDVAGGRAVMAIPHGEDRSGAADGRYRVRGDHVGFNVDVALR